MITIISSLLQLPSVKIQLELLLLFQTLDVVKTFRTNWRKQWSGNAFMVCGVLYVLKKYDEKYTGLNFMYNTHTGNF